MPDLVPTLRRVLRPLRPVLRPIWRRIRPISARSAAVARKPTDAIARKPREIPADQRWLYFHEAPEDQRISVLEGRHPGSRVLIVATGPSAKQVIPFDDRLKERYDVVVALNGSIAHVTSADYFLAVESHAHLWDWYHHPVGPHVTRCVSESGLRYAAEAGEPDTQPRLLCLRHLYETPVDIRHYRNADGEEGLLNGSRGETNLGRGTVTAQAMHFAGMLGASVIHVIGADLHFHGPVQHFYGQNEYGTHEVDGKRYHRLDTERKLNPIVEAVHPETGQVVESTLHFRESAAFIDQIVRDVFPPAGIRMVDFSHGLISAARRGDFATFMATGDDPADQPAADQSPAVPGGGAPVPGARADDAVERTADELRDYWRSPPDGNVPSSYRDRPERSAYLVELVRRHVAPEGRILEIGCNVGRNLHHLHQAGYTALSGIEISEAAVEALRASFPDTAARASVQVASAEEALPAMADGSFELVFTMAVLEHIHPSSESVFDEIRRIAAGWLITIEDERSKSWRHYPRDYGAIFTARGFDEVWSEAVPAETGLPKGFRARVFRVRPATS